MDFGEIFNLLGKDTSRIAPNSTGGASFPSLGPIDMTPGMPKGFGGFKPGADTGIGGGPPEITIRPLGTEGQEGLPTGTDLTTAGTGTGSGGTWDRENYFTRAIVIILGFIFVAVGLSMFKNNVVAQVVKAAK